MALDFNILNFERNDDKNRRGYYMKVQINGFTGEYQVFTDAKMIYNKWLPKDLAFSVLNSSDCQFNDELPYLKVRGLNPSSRRMEKEIQSAIVRFIKNECAEQ